MRQCHSEVIRTLGLAGLEEETQELVLPCIASFLRVGGGVGWGGGSLVPRPLLGRPARRCPVVTLVTACRPPRMQMWSLLLPRSEVTV